MSASIPPLSSDASGLLAELLVSAVGLSTTPSGPDLAPGSAVRHARASLGVDHGSGVGQAKWNPSEWNIER